jgi:hypothetical protein
MDNYGCDITYVTNSELGFDFLRDNLATVSSTSYAGNVPALAWSVLRDGRTLPSSTISGILLASAGCKLILIVAFPVENRARRSWCCVASISALLMRWIQS